MLSEEGSEAANKDIKDAEKNHAMKTSDLTILEQTFHRRMDISDVVIQSYSQVLILVLEIVSICMYLFIYVWLISFWKLCFFIFW